MSGIKDIIHTVCQVIEDQEIDALLIGGFAVNYYGYTRNTLDVDFMIAIKDIDVLCQAMREKGFSNIDRQHVAVFFNQPGSAFRVDFLQVDNASMEELLSRAVDADFHGLKLKISALQDLLAMKLFALKSNWAKRVHKDLPDVANLIVRHNVDTTHDLKTLCEHFADETIYLHVLEEIEAIKNP